VLSFYDGEYGFPALVGALFGAALGVAVYQLVIRRRLSS
jgi:hypothetical protein